MITVTLQDEDGNDVPAEADTDVMSCVQFRDR